MSAAYLLAMPQNIASRRPAHTFVKLGQHAAARPDVAEVLEGLPTSLLASVHSEITSLYDELRMAWPS